ncbi:TIGR03619 family F420-dependent LLM class oxidoreductase [Streptomyces sp. NPDC046977]|uniref:TIGR03619 family F420-dependent LLM class oxidoreductase n=1 Tax=Streptomyces sp. NPDC046977 TaxID=3154703 RepID=UPI0033D1A4A1
MRLGLTIPTFGPHSTADVIAHVSRTAEEMGYDSLWTGDRVLSPEQPKDPYPGNNGVMPRVFENCMDPAAALSFAAANTSRVRLGTSTLNALWQPPIMLARQLTTLDVLSGGRLDAGLGLGWMREEYEALGLPWARRGERLEETLNVLRGYWTAERLFTHEGRYFTIPETVVGLKPVQRPGPPVLLGAFNPAGLSRIARAADGWLSGGMPLPFYHSLWTPVLKEAEAIGRDPSELKVVMRVNAHITEADAAPEEVPQRGSFGQYVAYALSAAEAGVHELFMDLDQWPLSSVEERIDIAGRFIEGVRAG